MLVKDDLQPPTIDMDARYSGVITIKAGETLKLEAGVRGKPTPTVTWMKNQQEITATSRIIIKNTEVSSCIEIQETTREDSGTYSLMVQNFAGSRYVIANSHLVFGSCNLLKCNLLLIHG